MNNKLKIGLLLLVAALLTVSGASAVTVSVSPQTQDVAPGATFTFTVNIDSGTTDVQFAHVELNYDTTNFTANSVTAGDLLDPEPLTEPGSGTGTPGKVKYGLARTSSTAAPVNGTFITVQFTANSSASGKPTLDLDNLKLMDTDLSNISDLTINDGEVNISGTPVSTPIPTATPSPAPTSTPPSGGAKVFGSPQTQVVAPGATFTFSVNIDSGSEKLQFAHVELNYDSTKLTANTITPGNLLGADTLTEPGNGISSGKVKYGLARTSSAAAPVNGTFITVQFTAKGSASGINVLDLANAVLMNSTTSQISNPQVIDGEVNISGTPVLNWKFISVPYLLNNASVDYVLRGLVKGTDYTELYAWDSVGKQWISPVTNFTPLNGYLIKIDTSKTMPVLEKKTGAFIPPSLGLTQGWNLIGTSGENSMAAKTMLNAIDDSYYSIWNWIVPDQMYDPVVGINSNTRPAGSIGTDAFIMQPGISYWVWATEDTSLPVLGP